VDKNRRKCPGVTRRFRKLSICSVLLWLTIFFLPPAESLAVAPPDLLGTWNGTVNKVTPEGFFTETITLRVLQQWDKFFKGDITVGGVKIDFVSIIQNINATTYDASFSIDAVQLNGSFEIFCTASYINDPTQIVLGTIDPYQSGNENLNNNQYDVPCTLLRQ
jgi:hypothetical protein